MSENKKEESNFYSWFVMIVLFVLVALIILFYINKQKEREALEKLKRGLVSRKETLEQLRKSAEKKVRIIYNGFKICIVLAFFTICYFLHSIPHLNFIEYVDTCITFFGGVGIFLLVVCFVIEENPIDIFRFRSIMKDKIFNLIFQPIQARIDEIPKIEESIEATESLLKDLDKTKPNE